MFCTDSCTKQPLGEVLHSMEICFVTSLLKLHYILDVCDDIRKYDLFYLRKSMFRNRLSGRHLQAHCVQFYLVNREINTQMTLVSV